MTRKQFRTGWYSTRYTTDQSILIEPHGVTPNGNTPVCLIGHGRGGGATQGIRKPLWPYVRGLVEAGFVVATSDHARINSWGDADSVSALEDLDAKIRALGYTKAKMCGMGWSMGVPTLMSYAVRNPSKFSALWGWNAANDQQYFNDTSYSPPYTYSGLTNKGAFGPLAQGGTDEIPATFQPTSAATSAVTIPISTDPTGITLPITAGTGKSFADGNTFGGIVALPRATAPNGTFTYTSKDNNNLYGCKSIGAAFAVASGAAITTAWATQMPAYVPFNLASYYGGLGIKTRLVQSSDDNTVPPNMNANDANGFVGRAANSTNVSLRSPSPTGGHTFGIDTAQIPVDEVVNWFLANAA